MIQMIKINLESFRIVQSKLDLLEFGFPLE
jgi:hypothetical protein